jgi:hypothetical protein
MKPTLEALDRERVFAQYEDPATPPIRYRAVVREKCLASTLQPTSANDAAPSQAGSAVPNAKGGASEQAAPATAEAAAPAREILHDFKRFLEQVARHPAYNMRLHTAAFGSSERFYQIKDFAERSGWIIEQKLQMAKTGRYAKLLQLTPAGQSVLAAL